MGMKFTETLEDYLARGYNETHARGNTKASLRDWIGKFQWNDLVETFPADNPLCTVCFEDAMSAYALNEWGTECLYDAFFGQLTWTERRPTDLASHTEQVKAIAAEAVDYIRQSGFTRQAHYHGPARFADLFTSEILGGLTEEEKQQYARNLIDQADLPTLLGMASRIFETKETRH